MRGGNSPEKIPAIHNNKKNNTLNNQESQQTPSTTHK